MTNKEAVQNTLNRIELELRQKLFALAEAGDYTAMVRSTNRHDTADGLVNRWVNVCRLKSCLKTNMFDYLQVCRDLSHQDMETLKEIHKAMPE